MHFFFRPSIRFVFTLAGFICAGAFPLSIHGAELKVDINNSGRPLSEGNDPAFTPWSTNQTWFSGGDTISAGFSGVTVTFTRKGSAGDGLQPGYWKAGVQSTVYNVKLTADGIKVSNGDSGAQIEMRISGLSAGSHTLLVYHNIWDNHAGGADAPLSVSVNGSTIISSLPMSVQATNNTLAALSYVTFTATSGQEVVVLFASKNTATYNNVYINGFEIDTPNTKLQANNPVPNNADEHVNADNGSLTLDWGAATSGAASHDVYFGTSSNAVAAATHSSSEFRGNQISTSYSVNGINSLLTYFWRVDEVSSSGATTRGSVWYFRPRHLAFPGAEGYGRFARGGRGGVVVRVTNLNDNGAGSLRDAIEGNYGPRTVVFDVSGLITLTGDDIIIDGNTPPITVAGQTAPGKGICVKRQQFALSGAKDAIVRFMRMRVGKETGETQNGSGMSGVDHCIMDHCSISWGIDEEMSTRGAKNLSLQRTLISEALNVAGHQNYPPGTAHGYAASIGGEIASFHHNLLAHCEGRNWSLAGGLDANGNFAGSLDIFNNVVYNWGGRTTDGGTHRCNFVNNYYKPGAASSFFYALSAQYDDFPGTQQYYFSGNVMPGHFQLSNETSGRRATPGTGSVPTSYSPWVSSPFFSSYATIDEVTNAYKKVLSDVGCNEPVIDDHDARVIRETIDGTYTYSGSVSGDPGLPDTTADVGGWENYGNTTRPANWDTDHDGMPNWWEVIKGFNTNSPSGNFSESNSDSDGDGFTALEDYLNWMARPHADCNAGSTVDIDLDALSRGYTNSNPVYSFSGQANGTVTFVNGRYARFTPSTDANALGAFNYTVTDNKGYAMTRTVGIRIVGNGTSTGGVSNVTINVDLDHGATYSGTAAAPDSGATWNSISGGGTLSAVKDSQGNTLSGVSIALTSASGSYHFYNDSSSGSPNPSALMSDYTYGDTYTYSISGLTPGAACTLYAYSHGNVDNQTGTITLASANGGAAGSTAATGNTGNFRNLSVYGQGYNYVVLGGTVNSSGNVTFTVTNFLNGFQLQLQPASGPATVQAENGSSGGGVTIDSNNAGFNETGFANFSASGGYLEFNNVDGGSGGAATLTIRYALGASGSRTGSLIVNGVAQGITFNSTGSWTSWTTLNVNLTLASGANNTIRFESTGEDLGNIDEITVTPGSLPSPWVAADIGAVSAPGGASASSGVFTVEGSGEDIWDTADEFHYVYQTASGDCEIRARVTAVENTDSWAKAGVMIRETLNANSTHATAVVTPGSGVSFQRRSSTGGSSAHTTTSGLAAPYWIRVTRSGNTFTAYRSTDGSNWTTIGSENITMSSSVYIGLAVTSHNDGTLCTAVFDNLTVSP